eukprot:SAG31_NODE_7742_length_1602_cov_1.715139_2_plen_188_part_00
MPGCPSARSGVFGCCGARQRGPESANASTTDSMSPHRKDIDARENGTSLERVFSRSVNPVDDASNSHTQSQKTRRPDSISGRPKPSESARVEELESARVQVETMMAEAQAGLASLQQLKGDNDEVASSGANSQPPIRPVAIADGDGKDELDSASVEVCVSFLRRFFSPTNSGRTIIMIISSYDCACM